MPWYWWLCLIITIAGLIFTALLFYCCIAFSSEISRKEERDGRPDTR